MTDWPILSSSPSCRWSGALFILIIRGDDDVAARNTRHVALWTTLVTFVVSLLIWIEFDPAEPGFQFVEKPDWLGGGISYRMGVDGISMLFVLLTTFLMPFCILASWQRSSTASRNT